MSAPRAINSAGLAFIREFEGEVLWLYDDPAGFATFGVGHLIARKPVSKLWRVTRRRYGTKENPLPRAEALELSRRLFAADVSAHVEAVIKHVPERWRDTPGRLTALTSLSYNLGPGVLTPEAPLTSLGVALRASRTPENRDKIARAILLYDKAGGKTLPGLTRRRRAESELFVRSWR